MNEMNLVTQLDFLVERECGQSLAAVLLIVTPENKVALYSNRNNENLVRSILDNALEALKHNQIAPID